MGAPMGRLRPAAAVRVLVCSTFPRGLFGGRAEARARFRWRRPDTGSELSFLFPQPHTVAVITPSVRARIRQGKRRTPGHVLSVLGDGPPERDCRWRAVSVARPPCLSSCRWSEPAFPVSRYPQSSISGRPPGTACPRPGRLTPPDGRPLMHAHRRRGNTIPCPSDAPANGAWIHE